MKNIIKTALIAFGLIAFVGFVASPVIGIASAQENTASEICPGIYPGGECPPKEETDEKVNKVIKNIINLFSLVVGVTSVVMIIVGGLKYIVSSGDPAKITSAKNTILYALIGLVVVAMSQTIVYFVLNRLEE
jgi:hypothetical protein